MALPPPIPPPLPPTANKTDSLAIASLVLGVLSILGGALLFLPWVLAVIFGHIALGRIKRSPGTGGRGQAIAGLCLGYVSIPLSLGLFAAMAIPAFAKVRENSLRIAMHNNARMLASAAQQVFLEDDRRSAVIIQVDPASGIVGGELKIYAIQLAPGVTLGDNILERENGRISLRHPDVQGGREWVFDEEGRPVAP